MKQKIFKLSITLAEKAFICDNINDQDIIIKEFKYYDQASKYIDDNFTKIKKGNNYNYYTKKCPQASKSCHPTGWPKGNPKWKKEQGSSK